MRATSGVGSKVTLIHRGSRILRTMDHDTGPFLATEMVKKGINVLFDPVIESIHANGAVRHMQLNRGREIDAECVLFATGWQQWRRERACGSPD